MIQVGLISDTHLRQPSELLLQKLKKCFSNVEYILHAGDVIHPSVLDSLEMFAPVIAVRGNSDSNLMMMQLPVKRIVSVGKVCIGLVHGWGSGSRIRRELITTFSDKKPQVIVYGHTHYPSIDQVGDQLLVNPGSAMERRGAPFCSVGKLFIIEESVQAKIISLDI